MATQRDSFQALPAVPAPSRNETSHAVSQALRMMHTVGERAEDDYEKAVRGLRAEAVVAVGEIARWLHAFAHDLTMRWSLLYLLGDVRHAACVDVLAPEAKRKLGPVVSDPDGCEQQVEVEEVVCVMAVEALGRLAGDGDARALGVLLDVVATQDRKSLRRPAALAVIAAKPELRTRVEEALPANERYVLDLRDATMRDLDVPPPEHTRQQKRERPPGRRPFPPPRGRGADGPPKGG